jgi:hypothetical protein
MHVSALDPEANVFFLYFIYGAGFCCIFDVTWAGYK